MIKKIILLAFIASPVLSQNVPRDLMHDARIKEVVYRENDVVPINAQPLITSEIQFSATEIILAIEGGDTGAWIVTYHDTLPNVMFIKSTTLNSETNMTVITNQHHYYFTVKNDNQNRELSKALYALKFSYSRAIPFEASSKVINKYVSKNTTKKIMNTQYRFSGSPELVPKHVFDDGVFTYFELTDHGEIPAIFAVDAASGHELTVNVRRQGRYLVVQRVAPQFSLRRGEQVTSIFNQTEISRIRDHRRNV